MEYYYCISQENDFDGIKHFLTDKMIVKWESEANIPNHRTKDEDPIDSTKPRKHKKQRQTAHKIEKLHKEWPSWTHKKTGLDQVCKTFNCWFIHSTNIPFVKTIWYISKIFKVIPQ